MEAENSHSLLSASWGPGKLVVWFSLWLKAQEPGATESGAGRDKGPSLRRESKFALLLPFCFTQALDGSVVPTHIGEDWFSIVYWFNANLFQNTHKDTPRNNVLPAPWTSLSPIKSTHEINHHSSPSLPLPLPPPQFWLPLSPSLRFDSCSGPSCPTVVLTCPGL